MEYVWKKGGAPCHPSIQVWSADLKWLCGRVAVGLHPILEPIGFKTGCDPTATLLRPCRRAISGRLISLGSDGWQGAVRMWLCDMVAVGSHIIFEPRAAFSLSGVDPRSPQIVKNLFFVRAFSDYVQIDM